MNRVQGDLLGVNAANDAGFVLLLLHRVDISIVVRMIGVRPRQLVKMIERPGLDELGVPADFDVTGSILWIDDQQAHVWVGLHVPAFLSLTSRVEAYTLAILVAPD